MEYIAICVFKVKLDKAVGRHTLPGLILEHTLLTASKQLALTGCLGMTYKSIRLAINFHGELSKSLFLRQASEVKGVGREMAHSIYPVLLKLIYLLDCIEWHIQEGGHNFWTSIYSFTHLIFGAM